MTFLFHFTFNHVYSTNTVDLSDSHQTDFVEFYPCTNQFCFCTLYVNFLFLLLYFYSIFLFMSFLAYVLHYWLKLIVNYSDALRTGRCWFELCNWGRPSSTQCHCHSAWHCSTSVCTSSINVADLFVTFLDFLADHTVLAIGMILSSVHLSLCDALHCGWMIYPVAKVSEKVNSKCAHRNMILQLSTPYTNCIPSYFPPQNLIMWPFCLCSYKHGWVLSSRL